MRDLAMLINLLGVDIAWLGRNLKKFRSVLCYWRGSELEWANPQNCELPLVNKQKPSEFVSEPENQSTKTKIFHIFW